MVTTYTYDTQTGELTDVTYSDSTPALAFTYNRLGQQATITDATGTRSFDYDPATLQINAENLDPTFYDGLVLTRQYQTGNETHGLKGRTSGYTLGTQPSPVAATAYAYESTGRLHTISDGTDTFTYDYKTNSNLLASMEGPVHAVSYSYEPNRDLMSSIDNKAGNLTGSSISKYSYGHDALNRRTDRTQSGSAIATTSTDTFSYNPRSEVIGSENDIASAAGWNPSYTYDPIGNRLTSTGFFDSSYATNAVNQYSEIHHSSLILHPSFDADGNLTDSGTGWTYVWNAENRLIQATNGTTTIDFTYDYQGRLVKKDDGTNVKVYVYDDWNRIATFIHNCYAIYGTPPSSFTLHNSYLWGIDLSGSFQGAGGVGGLLREGNLYPLFDANGNIMQKLNGAGSVEMNVAYDPFGNIIEGALVGEYGFSTKPLIDDLNWYYYGFRYYDPETGRWPSRDPLGEFWSENLYRVLTNNLIDKIDYLGLVDPDVWFGVEHWTGRRLPPDHPALRPDDSFTLPNLPNIPDKFSPCLLVKCKEPCNSCCAVAATAGGAWIARNLIKHSRYCSALVKPAAVAACSLAVSAWSMTNVAMLSKGLLDCVTDCSSKPSQK